VDIGKAFTFVTDDEGWIGKIAIGGAVVLFSILLIPIPFLLGYQIAVMRNVMNGEEYPLPKWENWGKLFIEGLYAIAATLVYTLPVWILACLGVLFSVFSTDGSGALAGISVAGIIIISCLILIVTIALAFLVPAIYIQFVRTNEFGALFRFGEVIGIARDNIVDIILSYLVVWGANLVLSVITTILVITICGPFIASLAGTAWILVATGHLYGQIAAKSEGKKAEVAYGA